jgi:hypothetical protein
MSPPTVHPSSKDSFPIHEDINITGDSPNANRSSNISDEDEALPPSKPAHRSTSRPTSSPITITVAKKATTHINFPLIACRDHVAHLKDQTPYSHPGEPVLTCFICTNIQGNMTSMFDHFNKQHNEELTKRMHKAYTAKWLVDAVLQAECAGRNAEEGLRKKLRSCKASMDKKVGKCREGKCGWCEGFKADKGFSQLDRHVAEVHAQEQMEVVSKVLDWDGKLNIQWQTAGVSSSQRAFTLFEHEECRSTSWWRASCVKAVAVSKE